MIVVGKTEGYVEIRLTQDELVLLNNALNEVCHGVDFDDSEFQTRLGSRRSVAKRLLVEIGDTCRIQ